MKIIQIFSALLAVVVNCYGDGLVLYASNNDLFLNLTKEEVYTWKELREYYHNHHKEITESELIVFYHSQTADKKRKKVERMFRKIPRESVSLHLLNSEQTEVLEHTIKALEYKGRKYERCEKVFEAAEVDAKPKWKYQRTPLYPAELFKTKENGRVEVKYVINKDGKVGQIEVIESTHDMFTRSVLAAMEYWLFEPATLDGNPVCIQAQTDLPFRLNSNKPAEQSDGSDEDG